MTAGDRTRAILTIAHSEHVFELDGRDELTIGRRDCDVSIAQASISPKHARLVRVNGVWYVEDLGSVNGTFLGDFKIPPNQPLPLTSRSVFRVGDGLFRVDTILAPVPPPPPPPRKPVRYGPFIIPFVVVALVAMVGAAYSCAEKHEGHAGHGQEHKH
jgi:hypothetical protein